MFIRNLLSRVLPLQMKHQLRAGLFFTGCITGMLYMFGGLAKRDEGRTVGADMYVMF